MTFQGIISLHPFHGVVTAIEDFRQRADERRQSRAVYTRTLNELSAMSDRDLADIGVNRSEIPAIAAAAADVG